MEATHTDADNRIVRRALFAGPIDSVKVALNGPISDTYKEAVSALDNENTVEGEKHLYKMKEMLASVYEEFHKGESGLDGIDQKLKTQWTDLYQLEKNVQVMVGVLQTQIGRSNYRSNLNELKSRWEKLLRFTRAHLLNAKWMPAGNSHGAIHPPST